MKTKKKKIFNILTHPLKIINFIYEKNETLFLKKKTGIPISDITTKKEILESTKSCCSNVVLEYF